MRNLSLSEHKLIMLKMLDSFHKYCNEHDIKYSLIGGSLIGAVREGGIIPWDDDIDIILMPEEYAKLEKSLKKNSFNYRIIGYNNCKGYYNPAFKIVDDSTTIIEEGIKKNYGVFIDIFRYNYIPDNKIIRNMYFLKYKLMLNIIHGFSPAAKSSKNIVKKIRNIYSNHLNQTEYLNKFYQFLDKFNKRKTNNIIPNSLMYPFQKEMQKSLNTKEYQTVDFNGIKAMIFKDYDPILKKVFGDYMTPPPKEKRIGKHSLKVQAKKGANNDK